MARDPWEPRWDPEIFEGFRQREARPVDYMQAAKERMEEGDDIEDTDQHGGDDA